MSGPGWRPTEKGDLVTVTFPDGERLVAIVAEVVGTPNHAGQRYSLRLIPDPEFPGPMRDEDASTP